MKMRIMSSIATIVAAAVTGCASNHPIAIAPVGPAPVATASIARPGILQVFTQTETHADGDNTYYYPHTGYSIYTQSGQRVRYVDNHIGNMDETPTVVSLPAGSYKIVAQSASYGRVRIPVTIQGGQSTVVHLDGEWKPKANVADNQLVRLPNGEAVGYLSAAN